MTKILNATLSLLVAAVLSFGGALTMPLPAAAADNGKGVAGHAHNLSDVWAIARGGQLYDNWMAVIEADKPKGTHPAYPKAGKKKGAST